MTGRTVLGRQVGPHDVRTERRVPSAARPRQQTWWQKTRAYIRKLNKSMLGSMFWVLVLASASRSGAFDHFASRLSCEGVRVSCLGGHLGTR